MLWLIVAIILFAVCPAGAQAPCVVAPGDVVMPLACPAGTYTSPGVTFTPKPVEPPTTTPPPLNPILDQIMPGAWVQLANTKLSSLLPPAPSGTFAYSGAAFKDHKFYVSGGGHNDGRDNSVFIFDLATLLWSRLWGPSSAIPATSPPCSDPTARKYADGSPSARHTYYGIQTTPDRFVLIGGSMSCTAGDAAQDAWELSLINPTWTESPRPPFRLPLGLRTVITEDGTIYLNHEDSDGTLWKRIGPTWTRVGGSSAPYGNQAVAYDPKRKLIVYLTRFGTGSGITTQSLSTGQLTVRVLTGDPLPIAANRGALDYEATTDRMIVWIGGTFPYSVNLDINSVTRLSGGALSTGTPSDAGTYGRFRCDGGFCFLLRGVNENVFVYRVGSATTPPPATFPMTVFSSGGGHGTVTGAGVYAAGATVPLSATPDASSIFDGWAPAECANNPYAMPPRAVTCTASFSPKPIPPTGGLELVPGAFVRIAAPTFGGPSSGSKHTTWAPRPGTGLVYGMGGDFQDRSTEAPDSYRQEIYTFDLRAALAGDAERGWRRIQMYCQGGIQPKSPDYQGWVWDALRNAWWSVPGTSFIPGLPICPGRTVSQSSDPLFRYRALMLYRPDAPDPTQRWTEWDTAFDSTQQFPNWQSIHDVTDDKLIRFVHHGGNGGGIHVYSPATKVSRYKWMETASTGNLRLEVSLPCHDVANRRAYYADPYNNHFYRFDIATETLTRLSDVPPPSMSSVDPYVHVAWRPATKECWLWNKADRSLWVYATDVNQWRQELYTQVPAAPPLVNVTNAITWEPTLDVLLFLGTNAPGAGTGVWAYKP